MHFPHRMKHPNGMKRLFVQPKTPLWQSTRKRNIQLLLCQSFDRLIKTSTPYSLKWKENEATSSSVIEMTGTVITWFIVSGQ